MQTQLGHNYSSIITIENLLEAWREFLPGKNKKADVLLFQACLMDNLLSLHYDLANHTYRHGGYHAFKINDPKPRNIHKASVRDRLLHHAIYRVLYPYFDRKFIFDSYSCRLDKGTHRAMNRFRDFGRKASRNNTRTAWVLKCDIRKFFANIDHQILITILGESIRDKDIIGLLESLIESFSTRDDAGLPLGNLTSQLLVNIYMNEFDQFVKHELKAKYYIRYADDFVLLSENRPYLENILPEIEVFLSKKLRLSLHPDKVYLKTLASGVDFLGWVHFPDHRVLRRGTKWRMYRRIEKIFNDAVCQSYLGLLQHGNTFGLSCQINTKRRS